MFEAAFFVVALFGAKATGAGSLDETANFVVGVGGFMA